MIEFCRRKTVKVYIQQGHTPDSKWSCFCSMVFDDAGERANAFVRACCCFVARLQLHALINSLVWNINRNRLGKNISNTRTQLFLHSKCGRLFFFIVRKFDKLPNPWGSNHSWSNIIDWKFSRLFARFSANDIPFRSGKAETTKNLTDIKDSLICRRGIEALRP